MTIETLSDRLTLLSPTAGSTELAYDFELTRPDGLAVLRKRAGATSTLELGLDYSFPGGLGTPAGGTLTLLVPSLAGDEYQLVGLHPEVRLSDFIASQAFQSAKFNADLDALTMVAQEHRRDIDRSLKIPYDASAQVGIEPEPNQFIGWNADGTKLVNKGTPGELGAGDMLASNNLSDLDDAAEARANIDALSISGNFAEVANPVLAADNLDIIRRRTVADLLADTVLSYAPAAGKTKVSTGQIVEGGGYRYAVASAAAADHHITTSGGVKLYAQFNGLFDVTAILTVTEFADVKSGVGSVDVAAKLNVAFAASKLVFLPAGTYLVSSQLSMQEGQIIQGGGREFTVIKKGFNGDLFSEFTRYSGFADITLQGDGANFTGKLLPVKGSAGRQFAYRSNFLGSQDACLSFEKDAGSQSFFIDSRIARYAGTTSDAYCAVVIENVQQLSAKPRKFFGIETDGTYFIDFGGSNNTIVDGCFSGGFKFSDESRAVYITDGRWANQLACTVRGHQVSIVGIDVLPVLTLEGSGPITVGPGSVNDIIDNTTASGATSVYTQGRNFTPVWTAATTNPALGDGVLRGFYTRSGNIVHLSINLTIGSTTTLGTGTWRFSLPFVAKTLNSTVERGIAVLIDTGTTTLLGAVRVLNNATFLEIQIPGGLSLVNGAAPFAWANGDQIQLTIDYST